MTAVLWLIGGTAALLAGAFALRNRAPKVSDALVIGGITCASLIGLVPVAAS